MVRVSISLLGCSNVTLVAEELEEVGIETNSVLADVIALQLFLALLKEDGEPRESIEAPGAKVGGLGPCNKRVSHIRYYRIGCDIMNGGTFTLKVRLIDTHFSVERLEAALVSELA